MSIAFFPLLTCDTLNVTGDITAGGSVNIPLPTNPEFASINLVSGNPLTTGGDLIVTGEVSAATADITGLLTSQGVNAGSGTIQTTGTVSCDALLSNTLNLMTINSLGGVATTGGDLIVTGEVSAATADITGLLASQGVDAGSGTIQTTGTVSAATAGISGLLTSQGVNAGSGTIQTTGTVSCNSLLSNTLNLTTINALGGAVAIGLPTSTNGASLLGRSVSIGTGAALPSTITLGSAGQTTINSVGTSHNLLPSEVKISPGTALFLGTSNLQITPAVTIDSSTTLTIGATSPTITVGNLLTPVSFPGGISIASVSLTSLTTSTINPLGSALTISLPTSLNPVTLQGRTINIGTSATSPSDIILGTALQTSLTCLGQTLFFSTDFINFGDFLGANTLNLYGNSVNFRPVVGKISPTTALFIGTSDIQITPAVTIDSSTTLTIGATSPTITVGNLLTPVSFPGGISIDSLSLTSLTTSTINPLGSALTISLPTSLNPVTLQGRTINIGTSATSPSDIILGTALQTSLTCLGQTLFFSTDFINFGDFLGANTLNLYGNSVNFRPVVGKISPTTALFIGTSDIQITPAVTIDSSTTLTIAPVCPTINIGRTDKATLTHCYGRITVGDTSGSARCIIQNTGTISTPFVGITGGGLGLTVANNATIGNTLGVTGVCTVGSLSAGSGSITTTGSLSTGAATTTSLNAGSGTIQTTGTVSSNTVLANSAELGTINSLGGALAIGTIGSTTTIPGTLEVAPTFMRSRFLQVSPAGPLTLTSTTPVSTFTLGTPVITGGGSISVGNVYSTDFSALSGKIYEWTVSMRYAISATNRNLNFETILDGVSGGAILLDRVNLATTDYISFHQHFIVTGAGIPLTFANNVNVAGGTGTVTIRGYIVKVCRA